MSAEIPEDEWREFMDVVTKSIESHQDITFIETMALALDEAVYNNYKVFQLLVKMVERRNLKVISILIRITYCIIFFRKALETVF